LAQIEKGEIAFDVLVTTNDMMRELAKVAKIL
jgi:ribosomal protein L1